MLIVSIVLEACVAAVAVLAARQGRRPYLYGLAFTFAAYVLYDLARLLQWPVEGPLLSGLFLLASLTAYGLADFLGDRPLYEALLEREVIDGDELKQLIEGRKLPPMHVPPPPSDHGTQQVVRPEPRRVSGGFVEGERPQPA